MIGGPSAPGKQGAGNRRRSAKSGNRQKGVAGAKRSGAPGPIFLGLRCAQPPATLLSISTHTRRCSFPDGNQGHSLGPQPPDVAFRQHGRAVRWQRATGRLVGRRLGEFTPPGHKAAAGNHLRRLGLPFWGEPTGLARRLLKPTTIERCSSNPSHCSVAASPIVPYGPPS